jgi:NADH-quinone oxidoreductase subunit C
LSDLLLNTLQQCLGPRLQSYHLVRDELTVSIAAEDLLESGLLLRDDPLLAFEMLIDLCGVDYLHYGLSEWATDTASAEGFSRAVTAPTMVNEHAKADPNADLREKRFYVVYHLLSLRHNQRLCLKVFAPGDPPTVPSVSTLWNVANWYEREAYDLFGIIFENHPDLRRLLTDYGFVGHPFRKDFPLSGTVEVRYSAKDRRVVYEPVSIKPRILVPKIIRDDHRYKDLHLRPEQT